MNIKQEKREEKKLVTDKIIYWISELKIKFFLLRCSVKDLLHATSTYLSL